MGKPWHARAIGALLGGVGLWAVMAVHAAGQSLLASVLLAISLLALWTYGSARTHALRYLFPAVAAALLFVAFPMFYTVGMGLTNQSSRNLVDQAQAREQLLEERVVDPHTQRDFELWTSQGQARLKVLPLQEGGQAWWSAPIRMGQEPGAVPLAEVEPRDAVAVKLAERAAWLDTLRPLSFTPADGSAPLWVVSLREVAAATPVYERLPDGGLRERRTGVRFAADERTGFFTAEDGTQLQPGFRVFVGLQHYVRLFTEPRFREPFLGVFVWTVAFSGLTVLGAGALGLLLACLMNWQALQGRGLYRVILFLPYAVPAFLSILVFKGLFNQNLGEINMILGGLFGIKPAWFSDPHLARLMLLIVNIWLGFP